MAVHSSIKASDLLAFVGTGDGRQTTSVIVEAVRPTVPAQRVGDARRTNSSARRMLPPPASRLGTAQGVKGGIDKAANAMKKVEHALKAVGLESARRNDLSASFVVEATAQQIRELATMPGVQSIRPNRTHRKFSG